MKVGRIYVDVATLGSDQLSFKVAFWIPGKPWRQCHITYDLVRNDFVNEAKAGHELIEIRQRVRAAVEKLKGETNETG